jgi:hypothetical protein
MTDVNGKAQLGTDTTVEIKERLPTLAPPVFIHAAPRTSSTWFWLKFREVDTALRYYAPFNYALNWMTPQRADSLGGDSWESRHPKAEPYYREYAPLLRKMNDVEHLQKPMTMQWYLPQGGLRGDLRPVEKDYLSLLIEHANEAGRTPVLGDCLSLGRIRAIKQTLVAIVQRPKVIALADTMPPSNTK